MKKRGTEYSINFSAMIKDFWFLLLSQTNIILKLTCDDSHLMLYWFTLQFVFCTIRFYFCFLLNICIELSLMVVINSVRRIHKC